MIFRETRAYLKKLELPEGDLSDLPTSGRTFDTGATVLSSQGVWIGYRYFGHSDTLKGV